MKKILLTILLSGVTALLSLAQNHSVISGNKAQRVFPRNATLEIFHSDLLHCDDTVAVFSPATVPVKATLFLLHGYSGNWSDWGTHMDLQALCEKTGCRFICPDGFYSSWYFDDADAAKMQWRSFFWKECWPLLEQKYELDAKSTYIAGLSMGGHGAMSLFLDHPEYFAGAGSMSGVLDLRYSSKSKDTIPIILGKKDIEKCDKFSSVHRLEQYAALGPKVTGSKLLVIGCGTEDNTFYPASRLFEAECRNLGLRHVSLYSEGKHRWNYWTRILPLYIQIFESL